MWSWSTNVTDRQTDRRTTCNLNTALCTSASCGNNNKICIAQVRCMTWDRYSHVIIQLELDRNVSRKIYILWWRDKRVIGPAHTLNPILSIFGMWGGPQDAFLSFEFQVGRPFPLTRHIAYRTACSYRSSCDKTYDDGLTSSHDKSRVNSQKLSFTVLDICLSYLWLMLHSTGLRNSYFPT